MLKGLTGNRGILPAVVAAVAVAGGLVWTLWGWSPRTALAGTNFYFWFLLCMCAELLRVGSSGKGTASMAACVHIACMLVLRRPEAMAVVGLSALVASRVIQRRSWWQSAYEGGALMLVVGLAQVGFNALAAEGWRPSSLVAAGHYVPILAAAAIYFVASLVTRGAWAVVDEGASIPTALQGQFGPKFEVVSAGVLVSLGMLLAVQFKTAGALGIMALVLPVVVAKHGLDHFARGGGRSRDSLGSHERPRIAA